MEVLYQIDINYACFGVLVRDNLVVDSAPIAKWSIGKSWEFVSNYYINKKKAKILNCTTTG